MVEGGPLGARGLPVGAERECFVSYRGGWADVNRKLAQARRLAWLLWDFAVDAGDIWG